MERWDIYSREGVFQNRSVPKGAQLTPGEYHIAAEAWIVSSRGELLIQKRGARCEILPGIWCLTAGRVVAGETSRQGCAREVREELGLPVREEDILSLRRIVRDDGSHHIWDVFLIRSDADIGVLALQEDEVAAAKWVGAEEFRRMLREGTLFSYPEIQEVLNQAMDAAAKQP